MESFMPTAKQKRCLKINRLMQKLDNANSYFTVICEALDISHDSSLTEMLVAIGELKKMQNIAIKNSHNISLGLGNIALAWNALEDDLRKSEQLNKLGQAIFDAPA